MAGRDGNSKETVSLRDYVDAAIRTWELQHAALKELVEAKIKALEDATTLAKENSDIRMNINNDWKDRSIQSEANFATKDGIAKLEGRVNELEISRATLAGKASQTSVTIAMAFSFIGVATGIIGITIGIIGLLTR